MAFTILKRNYYYLISGLPEMSINGFKTSKLSIELKNELAEQLYESDYQLIRLFYFQYDNKNLLNLLLKQNKPFNVIGNYSEEFLNEQINEPTEIIEYMANYILGFKEKRLENSDLIIENHLSSLFYEYVLQVKNGFLKQWFRFDKDFKNILTAVNCKKYSYDLEKHLISVKNDNEIYDILLKNGAKPDLIAGEIPYANEIVKIAESEMRLTEKEKALDQIKWKFLDEITFFNYFTIEKIVSFIIKLEIAERWAEIDDNVSDAFFNKLVNDIKSGYEFSEEFNLIKNNS